MAPPEELEPNPPAGVSSPWWQAPWLAPAAVTVATFVFYLLALSYPWQLAVLAATALGALVYSTRATLERLHRLYTVPAQDGPDESVPVESGPEDEGRSGS